MFILMKQNISIMRKLTIKKNSSIKKLEITFIEDEKEMEESSNEDLEEVQHEPGETQNNLHNKQIKKPPSNCRSWIIHCTLYDGWSKWSRGL